MSGDATASTVCARFDLVSQDPRILPHRLVFGPQLVIGRNKEQCDLVSWFLPRGGENDRETRRLSQVHGYIEHEGGFVRIRDAGSARGTLWNRLPVPAGEGQSARVGQNGRVTLGRNYHIEIEWHPTPEPTCALLRPVGTAPAFRRCLWILGARCALRLDMADAEAWLMPAAEGASADAIVETRAASVWWVPLDGGAEARLEPGVRLSGEDAIVVR